MSTPSFARQLLPPYPPPFYSKEKYQSEPHQQLSSISIFNSNPLVTAISIIKGICLWHHILAPWKGKSAGRSHSMQEGVN